MVGRALALVGLLGTGCFFDSRMLQAKSLSPQHQGEQKALFELWPVAVAQPPPALPGPVRQRRVRVWVDASYRRRLHWREHVELVFAHANQYLEALAVELVPDVKPWGQEGDVTDLRALLAELMRTDPGEGVDHVMGLTSALPRLTTSQEQLGFATTPGKHMVLRAMNDALERQELVKVFGTLSSSDIDQVYDARTAHKEVVVLIHEWAHNMGAVHEDGEDFIMSKSYDRRAARLSEENLAVVAATLSGKTPPPAPAEALAATPTAPAEDHKLDDALRAAAEDGAAKRWAAALERLDAVRPPAGSHEADWQRLAAAYAGIGAYSRADEAFAAAGPGDAVVRGRNEARRWRRQRGVYGVAPEQEPEAGAAVEQAHAAVASDDDGAGRLIGRGLQRWPRLAGLLALRCGLELSGGHARAAEATCRRALQVSDETMLAHFFAAQAATAGKRRPEAIVHLERAIALDPGARVVYEELAPLYKEAGRPDDLTKLRASYQREFGKPLP